MARSQSFFLGALVVGAALVMAAVVLGVLLWAPASSSSSSCPSVASARAAGAAAYGAAASPDPNTDAVCPNAQIYVVSALRTLFKEATVPGDELQLKIRAIANGFMRGDSRICAAAVAANPALASRIITGPGAGKCFISLDIDEWLHANIAGDGALLDPASYTSTLAGKIHVLYNTTHQFNTAPAFASAYAPLYYIASSFDLAGGAGVSLSQLHADVKLGGTDRVSLSGVFAQALRVPIPTVPGLYIDPLYVDSLGGVRNVLPNEYVLGDAYHKVFVTEAC